VTTAEESPGQGWTEDAVDTAGGLDLLLTDAALGGLAGVIAGAGTSVMSRRCAASSSGADGIVYRFAFRCRQSKIEITRSESGESVGQAELSSREEAKGSSPQSSPGREAATAVECAAGSRFAGLPSGTRAGQAGGLSCPAIEPPMRCARRFDRCRRQATGRPSRGHFTDLFLFAASIAT